MNGVGGVENGVVMVWFLWVCSNVCINVSIVVGIIVVSCIGCDVNFFSLFVVICSILLLLVFWIGCGVGVLGCRLYRWDSRFVLVILLIMVWWILSIIVMVLLWVLFLMIYIFYSGWLWFSGNLVMYL